VLPDRCRQSRPLDDRVEEHLQAPVGDAVAGAEEVERVRDHPDSGLAPAPERGQHGSHLLHAHPAVDHGGLEHVVVSGRSEHRAEVDQGAGQRRDGQAAATDHV
jgi:hypothetical protein